MAAIELGLAGRAPAPSPRGPFPLLRREGDTRWQPATSARVFSCGGRKLVADQPKTARNSDAAVELAERLGSLKASAVAFSQEIDIETDTYDEPRVLYRVGTLPPGLFAED